jgi:L-aspartate oxidase
MGIVSDLEYVQFHPTALCVPNEQRFLLTEALRGEGAILRDVHGRAFASDYHPSAELAPRDVVARAVYEECRKSRVGGGGGGGDGGNDARHNAYLDITHRDPSWLVNRFPGVHAHLMSRTSPLDFTKDVVPVTPAAHYACGGVTTDLDGRVVSVNHNVVGVGGGVRYHRNLYAAGEAARTGLHGGNRLASTSLLEGLVFGSSVGEIVAGGRDANDGEASMMTRMMFVSLGLAGVVHFMVCLLPSLEIRKC